jgi:hypothetical protein
MLTPHYVKIEQGEVSLLSWSAPPRARIPSE